MKIHLFLEKLFFTLTSLYKVLLFSKYRSDVLKLKASDKKCYILGNGPSLNQGLSDYSEDIKQAELIAVNFFAISDLYEQLQPKYYVLADPNFFFDEPTTEMSKKAVTLFDEMQNRTIWDLFLLIPYEAYKYIAPRLRSNPNIHIIRYNKTSCRKTFLWFDRIVHNNQLAVFSGMNVVAVTSYLAIVIGFKEIHLLGVDHSWLKNYIVGKDNIVYFENPHFYDKSKKNLVPLDNEINPITKKACKFHELLMCDVVNFETYHLIEEYAQYKNIKILNRCLDSYIDAFEKK